MKMLRIYCAVMIMVALGCRDQEESEMQPELFQLPNEDFQVVQGMDNLSWRINEVNRTALMSSYQGGALTNGRTLNTNSNQIDYFWHHIASVDAPSVQGEQLSATHFDLVDDKVYVSYHKQGDTHLGALEIIDLSNPYSPQFISRANFYNADINALTANQNGGDDQIWLAASHRDHGATVYRSSASGNVISIEIERINLSNELVQGVSASANSICFSEEHVVVSAGKTHGGTFLLNELNNEVSDLRVNSNSKYVAYNGNYIVSLITGSQAELIVNPASSFGSGTSYSIGSIVHQNVDQPFRGKSTMEFSPSNNNEIMVAMGSAGVKSFDVTSGLELKESKGTMLLAGNSNAVSMDDHFIYMANGADGLAIAELNDSPTIDPVFHWDEVIQPASVNYVKSQEDFVFVAKGEGGFHILQKVPKDPYMTLGPFNSRGKPLGLEEDVEVCSELLTNIFSLALPERQNALTAHPEYFEFDNKNILMKEDGEVYLTFLHEGAGFKNILGYYTYQEGEQAQSPEDLEKIIIFPNASAVNSGGDLVPGNTMKLLGTFEKGTVIGFFLIANGWKGKITDGYYTQYTDIPLNSSGKQQSIIFHDEECNSTVICFEDINVPNGDNDFNDAIFQITADPPTAINPGDYIRLSN